MVTKTVDEEEVSQCKSVENSFFGAYKPLRQALQSSSLVREEEEKEVPIIEGGNGVRNTIIKAATPVKMIQMRSTHLLKLLETKGRQYQALAQHMQLEHPSRDVNVPLYSLETAWKRLSPEEGRRPEDEDVVFFERATDLQEFNGVMSELQRKKIKEAVSSIEKVWAAISMGAPMIPKGTMHLVQEHLGEGGEQLYADLMSPLSRPGAPPCIYPEHFWFCCIEFLSETTIAGIQDAANIDADESEDKDPELDADEESFHGQPEGSAEPTFENQNQSTSKANTRESSDLEIFDEKESLKQIFESLVFKDRQIESRFVEVSPLLLEREFIRVAGNLSESLMGDAIRQYLKYTIVDHPYPMSLANCREFCGLFGKKFVPTTKIQYPEIVKLLRDKKIQGHVQDGLLIESALNPGSIQMRVWVLLMRLVALYHVFMVPIRISFKPYPEFTSFYAVASDGTLDSVLGLHVLILLNTAFKDASARWVTERVKIFRETDFLCLFASLPIDWFGYACGFSMEGCLWLRLNKMVLYYSSISPRQIIYSRGEGTKIRDLLVVMILVSHICAAVYFFVGRAAPIWMANMGRPQISWLFIEDDYKDLSYERTADFHFVLREDAWTLEKYIFSVYWVAATITVNGQVGQFLPQNAEEIVFTIFMMILNMTMYRWIIGEVSSIIMSADDTVVKAREDLERVTIFTSSKKFSDELRDEIKSHFEAVQSGSTVDQDQLLAGLSHGLRVELARFISRDFLTKVDLFQGCSDQMLDSICVLLVEVNFMPEEVVFTTGEIAKEMYFVLHGSLEELDLDQDKVVATAHKNSALGTLPFFFGLRHFATARAARSGCVCMRLTRDSLFEVLKTHPKDEEAVMQNSLRTWKVSGAATVAKSSRSIGSKKSKQSKSSKNSKSSLGSSSKRTGSKSNGGSSGPSGTRSGSEGGSSAKRAADEKSHHSHHSNASHTTKENSSAVHDVKSDKDDDSGDENSVVSSTSFPVVL